MNLKQSYQFQIIKQRLFCRHLFANYHSKFVFIIGGQELGSGLDTNASKAAKEVAPETKSQSGIPIDAGQKTGEKAPEQNISIVNVTDFLKGKDPDKVFAIVINGNSPDFNQSLQEIEISKECSDGKEHKVKMVISREKQNLDQITVNGQKITPDQYREMNQRLGINPAEADGAKPADHTLEDVVKDCKKQLQTTEQLLKNPGNLKNFGALVEPDGKNFRLVHHSVEVDGKKMEISEVLKDPVLRELIGNDQISNAIDFFKSGKKDLPIPPKDPAASATAATAGSGSATEAATVTSQTKSPSKAQSATSSSASGPTASSGGSGISGSPSGAAPAPAPAPRLGSSESSSPGASPALTTHSSNKPSSLAEILAENTQPIEGSTIFAGDSNMQYAAIDQGFVDSGKKLLAIELGDYSPRTRGQKNLAINGDITMVAKGGQTSSWGAEKLEAMPGDLVKKHQNLVDLFGSNDFNKNGRHLSADDVFANRKRCWQVGLSNGLKVFACTVPPAATYFSPETNAERIKLNDRIRKEAPGLGINVIDLDRIVDPDQTGVLDRSVNRDLGDGIHLDKKIMGKILQHEIAGMQGGNISSEPSRSPSAEQAQIQRQVEPNVPVTTSNVPLTSTGLQRSRDNAAYRAQLDPNAIPASSVELTQKEREEIAAGADKYQKTRNRGDMITETLSTGRTVSYLVENHFNHGPDGNKGGSAFIVPGGSKKPDESPPQTPGIRIT